MEKKKTKQTSGQAIGANRTYAAFGPNPSVSMLTLVCIIEMGMDSSLIFYLSSLESRLSSRHSGCCRDVSSTRTLDEW